MSKYYKEVAWEAIKRMMGVGDKLEAVITVFLAVIPPGMAKAIQDESSSILSGFMDQSWWWISGIALFGWFAILCFRENYKNVEKIKPSLRIEYNRDDSDCRQLEKNPDFILLRFRVFNDGEKEAKDIKISLNNITPKPRDVQALPQGFHVANKNKEDEKGDPKFEIDGSSSKLVDVLSVHRTRGHKLGLMLAYTWPSPINFNPQSNIFEFSVHAGGSPCGIKKFEIFDNGDAEFCWELREVKNG